MRRLDFVIETNAVISCGSFFLTGNPDSSEAIQLWGKHPSLMVGISPLLMTDLSDKVSDDQAI
jgi:hypothetical protein